MLASLALEVDVVAHARARLGGVPRDVGRAVAEQVDEGAGIDVVHQVRGVALSVDP